MKPPQNNPQHANYLADYGTPSYILDTVLRALEVRKWTLDMCSSAEHNKRIHARHYYAADNPCPDTTLWPEYIYTAQVVWCNPPGRAWRLHYLRWTCYAVKGAYLAYSTDQLRGIRLRNDDCIVLLRKRVRYLLPDGVTLAKNTAPCPSALIVRGATNPWELDKLGEIYARYQ